MCFVPERAWLVASKYFVELCVCAVGSARSKPQISETNAVLAAHKKTR